MEILDKPLKIVEVKLNKETKPPLLSDSVFWGATIIYGLILIIGFFHPWAGLAGLFLLALISILKIIFKNFALIAGMIILGLVCTIIPFLLIIYIPLLIIFFIMRLGYFLEHWEVVLAGLVVYFLPAFIFIKGGGASIIIPMILLPVLINYFYKNYDYTVEKTLELMSEAPVLIISIILPFLKLGASFGDAHVASSIKTVPTDGHFMPQDAITAKPIAMPHVSYSSNPDIAFDVNHAPVDSATPVVTYNQFNPDFNLDSFFKSLSHSHQLFNQTGSETISSFGNNIHVGMGMDQVTLIKDGFHLNILDSSGHQVGIVNGILKLTPFTLKMAK